MGVISSKIVEQTDLRRRISNGTQQKDGNNEQSKCLVGESSSLLDETVEVKEGGHDLVEAHPDTNPCVECEKGDVEALGDIVAHGLECQDGPGSSVDHLVLVKLEAATNSSYQLEVLFVFNIGRWSTIDDRELTIG